MGRSPYDYLQNGAKFAPGEICISRLANEVIAQSGISRGSLMDRHLGVDWEAIGQGGELLEQLKRDVAVGAAIQSSHQLPTGEIIFIETREDRSMTIICTLDET